MSLKEFTARCSAITLITASAYGIALAAEPQPVAPDSPARAQTPAADSAISGRVTIALTASNIRGLAVHTEQGVVTLSSKVASEEQRQKAAHIAAAIDGVRSVDIAQLKVQGQA